MGLLDFVKDQFLDVIEFEDISNKLIVFKFQRESGNNELKQGSKLILSVPAFQTEEDLEQNTIQFCNAVILPGGTIRLVYGNIDLNLAGYLYY